MQWNKKPIDHDETKNLSKNFGINLIAASIFIRRNIIDSKNICYFLEQNVQFLHNPFLFSDMEAAVNRINSAIKNGEKIFVYGDRDVDGITSTILLFELLNEFNGNADWGLPIGDESYGVTKALIDKLKKKSITLLITVDCGISNFGEINYAAQNNIDTIIIDHHYPPEEIPKALAIINPKQKSSGYPFEGLSACGVVSKLEWALRFSQTKYYCKNFCLLNTRPLNNAFLIECVKLRNAILIDRINENLIPGMMSFSETRLFNFLENQDIIVFDEEVQKKQLNKVFKGELKLSFLDIKPIVQEKLPHLADKNLLMIKELHKIARYRKKQLTEVDVLADLFNSLIVKIDEEWKKKVSKKMDLVALATLADIMPLKNENRIIVSMGLDTINSTKRKGLKEMILKKGLFNKTISSTDVVWQIIPVLNASGRMGEPDKALKLLLSQDMDDVNKLLDYVLDLNKKRKHLVDSIWNNTLRTAKESLNKTENRLIYVFSKKITRGITGILASRLMNTFKLPAIVIALLENIGFGSIRSPQTLNIKDFLKMFHDILLDYGGHDFAGGFSISLKELGKFENKLCLLSQAIEYGAQQAKTIEIDAEIPPAYLTPDLIKIVDLFEPYGEENPPLLFLTRGLKILDSDLFGKKGPVHLKLLLDSGKYKWPAVFWNSYDKWGKEFHKNDKIDLIYKLSRKMLFNQQTIQMIVIDIKKHK